MGDIRGKEKGGGEERAIKIFVLTRLRSELVFLILLDWFVFLRMHKGSLVEDLQLRGITN